MGGFAGSYCRSRSRETTVTGVDRRPRQLASSTFLLTLFPIWHLPSDHPQYMSVDARLAFEPKRRTQPRQLSVKYCNVSYPSLDEKQIEQDLDTRNPTPASEHPLMPTRSRRWVGGSIRETETETGRGGERARACAGPGSETTSEGRPLSRRRRL